MDYAELLADLEDTLAKHAPGGMVGAIVMAVELYDEEGEPRLHTVRSETGTGWHHLGMIDCLRIDTETPFRQNYDEDD